MWRLYVVLGSIALGFLAHHWQVSALDAVLRVAFIVLIVTIPLTILAFLWAFVTRPQRR